MLRYWYKFLPLHVIEYIARRKCQRTVIGNHTYIAPFRDVFILDSYGHK